MNYPIGIQNFGEIRCDGYVYVDKTAFIYKMGQKGNTISFPVCVSSENHS
jgi:hypothetical protein